MSNQRYRAFAISAEEGSFSKTAEIMNYTTPAVSQLVSALEKDLGFRLLVRHRRGVTPTREAETILPTIRELLLQEERLEQLIAEINGLTIGQLSIGSYSSIAANWLPAIIKEFTEQYPGIRIHMREGIRQENKRWLAEKLVDLAFATRINGMSYDWIPLREDPLIAVLPKSHPLANAAAYPIDRLRDESFIMPALGRDEDIVEVFQGFGLQPNIAFTTLENFSAEGLIEQGLGITITNELITRNFKCDVVRIPLDPPMHIMMGINVPYLADASPAVRKFVEFVRKTFET